MVFDIPNFTLYNGKQIPGISFGSGSAWRLQKIEKGQDVNTLSEELVEAVKNAIDAGFTHLDTAEIYETHREICEGIKRSGVDRTKLQITSKYLPGYRGKRAISKTGPYEAINTALRQLETDYIDYYYIHNPFFDPDWTYGVTVEEAWSQMERAYEEGLVKSIGVSNFDIEFYEKVLAVCKVKPMLLQVEMHPYCYNQRPGIVEFAKAHGAQVVAYGSLTPILKVPDGPLTPILEQLANKYNKTKAQILLRWIFQNGVVPLTTSGKPERLRQALDIFTFEMSNQEIELITKVGATYPFRAYLELEWGKYTYQ